MIGQVRIPQGCAPASMSLIYAERISIIYNRLETGKAGAQRVR